MSPRNEEHMSRNTPEDVNKASGVRNNGINKNKTKEEYKGNTSMVGKNGHSRNSNCTDSSGNITEIEENENTIITNEMNQSGTENESKTNEAFVGFLIGNTSGGENNGHTPNISQSGHNNIITHGADLTTTNENIVINRNTSEEDGKMSIACGGEQIGNTTEGEGSDNEITADGNAYIVNGDEDEERQGIVVVEFRDEDYENAQPEIIPTENDDVTSPMTIVHIESMKLGNV